MSPAKYPFSAIVGQDEMKLALLLAAIDWRLGVLLRGDKGSGKTTTARALAALLPAPAPFVNLPIGTTEDRLLGGLHIEQALKGDPTLKPGLLAEAHGGVLYVDEVNLLPAHLGDALLDTAASGIHVVEREGFSLSHPAEFVLLGSMNPEEGSLRPQLLDRFALAATVSAPIDIEQRQHVMERRIAFERDPNQFLERWKATEESLRTQIALARERLPRVQCSTDVLNEISTLVCNAKVRSLRADLAIVRAAAAYAALNGSEVVHSDHVQQVSALALNHRVADPRHAPPPPTPPRAPQEREQQEQNPASDATGRTPERIFAPQPAVAPAILSAGSDKAEGKAHTVSGQPGPAIGARPSSTPKELDVRTTLVHSLRENGSAQPQASNLHERIRKPTGSTRYLFLIDSSGSHAVRERMRLVKGAAISLLNRSFRRGDEAAVIVFRGTSAEVILEPTSNLSEAVSSLEYIPTGGRTPLAHGLELSKSYETPDTLLIVMTDGRANYALHGGDPWQDALTSAKAIRCAALVVDTDISSQAHHTSELANSLGGRCMTLEDLSALENDGKSLSFPTI